MPVKNARSDVRRYTARRCVLLARPMNSGDDSVLGGERYVFVCCTPTSNEDNEEYKG